MQLFGARDVQAGRDALQANVERIADTLHPNWALGTKQDQVNALFQAAESALQAAQAAARLAVDARFLAGFLSADLPDKGGLQSPDEDRLFEALRAWRLGRARKDGLSPYIVAYDRTLRAIAQQRPTTLDALAGLPGMGPAKVVKYGPEILAALGAAGP